MTEYVTLTAVIPEEGTVPESAPVDPENVIPEGGEGLPEPPKEETPGPDAEPEEVPDAPDGAPDAAPDEAPDAKPEGDPAEPSEDSATTTGAEDGSEETETGELVEVDEGKDIPIWERYDTLTLSLMGAVLVLAAVAAVLGALLWRKKKVPAAAAVSEEPPAGGSVTVGKLHELGDRESQQDCFAVSPAELYPSHGILAVVADGMGGLADGDKVSEAVVTAMMDGFFAGEKEGNILMPLALQANKKVNQLLGPSGIGRSGSTMVAGLIRDGYFHYISIGDSRICLYRDGQLMQLNREHVYENELSIAALNGIGTLHSAAVHPNKAGLTSYLGMGQLKYVDIPAQSVTVREGDKFILMSDGVYNALQEFEIKNALKNDAETAAASLGAMIAEKAYRNQDNYSAVILAV